jgi:hypothetical protein
MCVTNAALGERPPAALDGHFGRKSEAHDTGEGQYKIRHNPSAPIQLGTIMSLEYKAQILRLRLPGQNTLKNAPERCSADPVMLETIGRSFITMRSM